MLVFEVPVSVPVSFSVFVPVSFSGFEPSGSGELPSPSCGTGGGDGPPGLLPLGTLGNQSQQRPQLGPTPPPPWPPGIEQKMGMRHPPPVSQRSPTHIHAGVGPMLPELV